MAQAARLSLRMQKELKLLLNDPPPGVSVLLPSDNEELPCSSLSVINASIKGPDGTAYANGVFHIRVQIPERYPFLPPNITFVTPIYHPNIDNGGRICLDILNMPPKGAWMPSLNISTVLTSITLLLSDPNPDDGLMCDISREYKYNRQVFELKARSWTEKFAQPDISFSRHDGCSKAISSEGLLAEQGQKNMEYHDFDSQNNGNRVIADAEKLSTGCTTDVEKCCGDPKEYASLSMSSPKSEASPTEAQSSYSNKENDVSYSRLSLSFSKNFIVSKAASTEYKSDYKENIEAVQHTSPCHSQNPISPSSVIMNNSSARSKENNRLSLNHSGKSVKAKKVLVDSSNTRVTAGSPSRILLSLTSDVFAPVPSKCGVLLDISNRALAHKVSSIHVKNLVGPSKNLTLKRPANSNQHVHWQDKSTQKHYCNHKGSSDLNSSPNISKTTEVVIVSDSEESDYEVDRSSGNKMYNSRKRMAGLSKYKRPHM